MAKKPKKANGGAKELDRWKERLLVDVTEQERDRLGREVARLTQERVSLEAQKAEMSTRIGSEIKKVVLAIATAAHVVETGRRLEDVEVADLLAATQVRRTRLDTLEVLSERAATADELQEDLPLDPKPETPAPKRGKKSSVAEAIDNG